MGCPFRRRGCASRSRGRPGSSGSSTAGGSRPGSSGPRRSGTARRSSRRARCSTSVAAAAASYGTGPGSRGRRSTAAILQRAARRLVRGESAVRYGVGQRARAAAPVRGRAVRPRLRDLGLHAPAARPRARLDRRAEPHHGARRAPAPDHTWRLVRGPARCRRACDLRLGRARRALARGRRLEPLYDISSGVVRPHSPRTRPRAARAHARRRHTRQPRTGSRRVQEASARNGSSVVSSSGPTAGSQSFRHVVHCSAADSRRMSQLSKTEP